MRVYIQTINEAKRELAKVYNLFKNKKIECEEAKMRTYILRAIIEACYKYDIELRVIELEDKVSKEARQ